MNPPLEIVDAFTSRPFGGNPAAICLLDHDATDEWRQNVAAEMNLSETAYVRRIGNELELRWFTPTVEVDLCGHATLAAAHVLWRRGLVPSRESITFQSRSGPLICTRDEEWIFLDFPATAPESCAVPDGLLETLGIESAIAVVRSRYDLLVEVGSVEIVRKLAPDIRKLKAIRCRGVIVTAQTEESEEADFVSRFFAPQCGIDEDPVCGSAHCTLGPYWGKKQNKSELVGHQISQRGGIVRLTLTGNRVRLGGQAVTVLVGELLSESNGK